MIQFSQIIGKLVLIFDVGILGCFGKSSVCVAGIQQNVCKIFSLNFLFFYPSSFPFILNLSVTSLFLANTLIPLPFLSCDSCFTPDLYLSTMEKSFLLASYPVSRSVGHSGRLYSFVPHLMSICS